MSAASESANLRERAVERGVATGIEYLRWPRLQDGADHTVVLLHGIGSNSSSWVRTVAELDGSFDVIAWNAPGYGLSAAHSGVSVRVADYCDRLEAFLDALAVGPVFLVGHSLGALFAAGFAVSRPARVAALGLLSPAGGYAADPHPAMPPQLQVRLDDFARLGATEFAATRAAKLVFDPERHGALVEDIRTAMAAVKQPGYGQAVEALRFGSLADDAARVTCPTLVAVGAEDRVTPPAGARSLASLLPGPSAYIELPGVGHALTQQAPAFTAEAIKRLCAGTFAAMAPASCEIGASSTGASTGEAR